MSKSPTGSDFASGAAIQSRSYRGPDRRDAGINDKAHVRRKVTFDGNGDPVLNVFIDVPRRRQGDETIDALKCLDATALSLQIADEPENSKAQSEHAPERNALRRR
jgi:hypothetical protein